MVQVRTGRVFTPYVPGHFTVGNGNKDDENLYCRTELMSVERPTWVSETDNTFPLY